MTEQTFEIAITKPF